MTGSEQHIEGSERLWADWPLCGGCQRRRQTLCPTCGHAGNTFLLAEYQAAVAPQRNTRASELSSSSPEARSTRETRSSQTTYSQVTALTVLLMCPQCDEAFTPRFYRYCPACGSDGGDGIEPRRWTGERLSSRAWLAIYGLLAVVGLVLLYFWALFQWT